MNRKTKIFLAVVSVVVSFCLGWHAHAQKSQRLDPAGSVAGLTPDGKKYEGPVFQITDEDVSKELQSTDYSNYSDPRIAAIFAVFAKKTWHGAKIGKAGQGFFVEKDGQILLKPAVPVFEWPTVIKINPDLPGMLKSAKKNY